MRLLRLTATLVALLPSALLTAPAPGRQPAEKMERVTITVLLSDPNAVVEIDGQSYPGQVGETTRTYNTPPLPVGRTFVLHFKASSKGHSVSRDAEIKPGGAGPTLDFRSLVRFTVSPPSGVIKLEPKKAREIRLNFTRAQGFDGPIEISYAQVPGWLQINETSIPANRRDSITIVAEAGANASIFGSRTVNLIARSGDHVQVVPLEFDLD